MSTIVSMAQGAAGSGMSGAGRTRALGRLSLRLAGLAAGPIGLFGTGLQTDLVAPHIGAADRSPRQHERSRFMPARPAGGGKHFCRMLVEQVLHERGLSFGMDLAKMGIDKED